MKSKLFLTIVAIVFINSQSINTITAATTQSYSAHSAAPNNGTFTPTNFSVSIYTETGHSKGSFAVYLHSGQRYIKFNNTWICIQGKNRFFYNGNWYVIK